MSKNIVEPEGPQMTSHYGAYALHAGQVRLHERMYAPGHIHARARTHRQMRNTAFPRQQ